MTTQPLPALFGERLRLPLIAAPMFRVSGLDLTLAGCRPGVVGSSRRRASAE